MRLPVLIFDFGNVVAHFDYARAFDPIARRRGLTGADLLAQARRDGLTPLVTRYEAGALTDREFAQAVLRLIPGPEPIAFEDFASSWKDIFHLNESVVHLADDLHRQGHLLLLGSNTNPLHAEFFRPRFAQALAPFSHLILSYEVGHNKPSLPFFQACAQKAGVPPADCVFIDDLPENVAGAIAAGMSALVYRDTPTLIRDLATHGVKPKKGDGGNSF